MRVKLGDICKLVSGNSLPDNIVCSSGELPYVKVAELNLLENTPCITTSRNFVGKNDVSDKQVIPVGTVVFPKRGGAIGTNKKRLVSVPICMDLNLMGVIPSSSILPQYLYYFFENIDMGVLSNGSSVPQINNSDIAPLEIRVPDKGKQNEIVVILDKVSNLISLRKQQLAKLDELVKSRFVELFGDPVLNQNSFPCYTVGDVIEFQGGSQPDKKYFEYEATEDNIRLIQIRDYKTDKYITYIPKAMAKRFCTADDIMIGRYGPPIFQILKGIEGSFNVALMKATPKMGNREFVRYFLKQDCLLTYLEGLSQRTAGQDGIQMDKLKAYPFPFPPMELQEQFAAFVEQTDKSKVEIQKSLEKLETLKKALMQKYFG